MIRGPGETSTLPAGVRKGLPLRMWIWACLLLVVLTWTPVLGIHLRNMSLGNPAMGPVVVVFPPTLGTRDLFRVVADARGTPVSRVDWMPGTWIVQSVDPGFVGRLRERGAWGVYSTELLSVRRLLSCSGMVSALALPLPSP